MRWSPTISLLMTPALAWTQEGALHADFRGEGARIASACEPFTFKVLPGCGYELFSDHPLHITAGSLPPQNGFAVGPAFTWAQDTINWRLSADVDAVGAPGGSWRAGGYLKLIHTPHPAKGPIQVVIPTPGAAPKQSPAKKNPKPFVHPYTVFNLYAHSISLNKLNFLGLGNDTTLADASVFGMSETIVGGNVIKPVFEWAPIRKLNLALLGEVHGRVVSVRGESGQSVPSIDTVYTNATAPGLGSPPAFLQLGEGFRVQPRIGSGCSCTTWETFSSLSLRLTRGTRSGAGRRI